MTHSLRRGLSIMTVSALAAAFFASFGAAAAAGPNDGIEAAVREAFADAPVMIAVAKCESGYRQFASEGVVLRGGAGKGYIGIFQIGESLHAGRASSLGQDIYTTQGNIAYARHLYDEQGSVPWRECVPSEASAASTTSVSSGRDVVTLDLRVGMRSAQALLVQRILNAKGYAVAASGPGSAGQETEYFGSLTRDAVRRFQCATGIVCAGDEWSTGYGRVGPKTRAALNRD